MEKRTDKNSKKSNNKSMYSGAPSLICGRKNDKTLNDKKKEKPESGIVFFFLRR